MKKHRASAKVETPALLPIMTPEEAAKAGYRPISSTVNRQSEAAVFASIERGLASCDAIWICTGRHTFEAARKAAEIVQA